MNLIDRLQEYQDGNPSKTNRGALLQYRLESLELERMIKKTTEEGGYCTTVHTTTLFFTWLTRTGYFKKEAVKQLSKLGYKVDKSKTIIPVERTELANLILNSWRVCAGKRKLPGYTRFITIEYDGDGDGRWRDLRIQLEMAKAELDVWTMLKIIYAGNTIDALCNNNPSPPMRKKLEEKRPK
ncbi:hypothetical protein N9X64_00615 [bacterium]|nr:hypothetical protein [bacterium]